MGRVFELSFVFCDGGFGGFVAGLGVAGREWWSVSVMSNIYGGVVMILICHSCGDGRDGETKWVSWMGEMRCLARLWGAGFKWRRHFFRDVKMRRGKMFERMVKVFVSDAML